MYIIKHKSEQNCCKNRYFICNNKKNEYFNALPKRGTEKVCKFVAANALF
jgi:hypothetical protein